MEHHLRVHPFFEVWTDPETGVESFILTERVAPVQQSFYFTNPSLSADGNCLWFYTAFPPAQYRTLGVVGLDPRNPIIRHLPRAQMTYASPMVAPEGDAAYYCCGPSVWRVSMGEDPVRVCTLSDEYIHHRHLKQLATHLTRSADGKYFLLDGSVGNHWFVGLGDTDTGEVEIIKEFGRCYNHAQFHPTDPETFLIAQDWWRDAISGQYFIYDHRIWLMDTHGGRFEPLRPSDHFGHNTHASHEWWSKDGLICWIDYERGAFECNVADREAVNVWPGPLCHGHCDSSRRYWCADESPYKWNDKPCQVLFFDRERGREINIASGLPKPSLPCLSYHLDPHPQFSSCDSWVIYTTTVRGKVDIALTSVEHILERMG